MSREKRLACPQCEETNNIVTRHRKRGPKVLRERFCRECRRRFYTESTADEAESYCGNPFAPRARRSVTGRRAYR